MAYGVVFNCQDSGVIRKVWLVCSWVVKREGEIFEEEFIIPAHHEETGIFVGEDKQIIFQ